MGCRHFAISPSLKLKNLLLEKQVEYVKADIILVQNNAFPKMKI